MSQADAAATEYHPRRGVVVEPVGASWAAYSPASGETQLLNDSAATLIELLQEEPCSVDRLANRLAVEMEVSAEAVRPVIDEALRDLVDCGLVVAAACLPRDA